MTLLILFQSCRVYHRDSVSLNQAVKEGKRVKIKTIDNKTLKFKRIIYEDGEYYGIKPITFMNKVYKIIPLNQNKLQSIRLHNKTWSIIYGVGISIVIISIVMIVIALTSFDLNLDSIPAPI